MTPEQTTHYMAMKRTAMLVLDNDLVIAQQAMTQLLRLQQILCGYIPTDDGIKEIPTRRLDAMAEAVEEMTGKVIIWARFRRDIEQIVERLQKDYGDNSVGAYYGDTSDEDREALVVNFQDPTTKLGSLLATRKPLAMGSRSPPRTMSCTSQMTLT